MGEIRIRYSFSVGNHKGKKPLESCGLNGRMILKWVFTKGM
jgi:hypothetical protein